MSTTALTERELAVLKLRKEGKTQAEIAKILQITQPAVSSFDRNAKKKIDNAKELLDTLKKLGLLVLGLIAFSPIFMSEAHAVTPNPGHDASGVGSGTFGVGDFIFQQSLTVNASLFFVDSQNKQVGINTSDPNATLHIVGNTRITAQNTSLFVENTTGGAMFVVNVAPNGSARVGIGLINPQNALSVNGTINASGTINQGSGLDIAEQFGTTEKMGAGDIVAIVDRDNVKKSTTSDASLTIGVVSTQPGFTMSKAGLTNPQFIAVAGRVPVKINSPVIKGDYITVSDTPGVGMAATQPSFVVGRALEDSASGSVMVLVNPGYFSPRVDVSGSLIGGSTARVYEPAIDEVLADTAVVSSSTTFANNTTDISSQDMTVSGELQTDIITPAEGRDVVVILG